MEQGGEPLRPGWYPSGDGIHQQFYAGRDTGWTESYELEIDLRDPQRLPPSRRASGEITLMIALCLAAVIIGAGLAALTY